MARCISTLAFAVCLLLIVAQPLHALHLQQMGE
jgi:hypothetical protein